MSHVRNIYKLILLTLTLGVTTSCNPYGFPTNSSDPNIIALIDFTNNFSLQTCLNTYKSAYLEYSLVDNLTQESKEEEIGRHDVTFEFSMERDGEYYSKHIEYLHGTLKSEDYPNLTKFERNISPLGDKRYDYVTLHDDVRIEEQSDPDMSQADAYSKLYQFYANEGGIADGAVNGGGMYYGDEILINANQYWNNMRVDDIRNVLIYEFKDISMNHYTKASVKYEVNIHGMLTDYYQIITETKDGIIHEMICNMSVSYSI